MSLKTIERFHLVENLCNQITVKLFNKKKQRIYMNFFVKKFSRIRIRNKDDIKTFKRGRFSGIISKEKIICSFDSGV
jgi:hypothetical protein